jgi:hypothetical protein
MTSQRTPSVSTDLRPRLTIDRLREVLRAFLPDYLRLSDPDSANLLDLERIVLLHTEDPALVAATVPARKTPDLVTVLVVLQEHPLSQAEISTALKHHLAQLDLRMIDPILLSLIFLDGGRPGFNLETAPVCRLFDLDLLRIYYLTCGLKGMRAEHYADLPMPLAWALAPYLSHASNPAALRARCRARITAASDLDETRRTLLLRCVDAAG